MIALLEDRPIPAAVVLPRPVTRPPTRRPLSQKPPKVICKLCKRAFHPTEGAFFTNGQTGRQTDFQCRLCTAWETAPERTPGNVRTDVVHYA